MKPTRLSAHVSGYLQSRGFTAAEVEDAILTSVWRPAEHERYEFAKEFPCGALWNGRLYATKQVRPVFVELGHEILVVTVYTYYH